MAFVKRPLLELMGTVNWTYELNAEAVRLYFFLSKQGSLREIENSKTHISFD